VSAVTEPAGVVEVQRRVPAAETSAPARPRSRRKKVSRTVILLGLTSLFTDISAEMVATVLPLYLVYVGGMSVLAYGVIDGLYNGATALAGLASGFVGDRLKRHKEIATSGYGLSAISKLLLAVVGTAGSSIGALVLIDRMGKGIRTAPRDAMISLSTTPQRLGAAFGVHRAFDTTGAMIGPLIAFGLLALAPLAFQSLFIVSFCFALIGLGILVLFVRAPAADGSEGACPAIKRGFRCNRCTCAPELADGPPSLRRALELVRMPRYRALLIAGGMLSLATASDAFIFLAIWDRVDLSMALFPLLFVGVSAVFMLLAAPLGRFADSVGRGRVFLGGYLCLLAVYAFVLGPVNGWVLLVAALGFLGVYYAATDGVLMALGSGVVPEDVRGSGLALLRTATSVARMVASIAFGALWALWGSSAAFACFGALLLTVTLVSAAALRRTPAPVPEPAAP
jgi:MFS family permease